MHVQQREAAFLVCEISVGQDTKRCSDVDMSIIFTRSINSYHEGLLPFSPQGIVDIVLGNLAEITGDSNSCEEFSRRKIEFW